eukprot:Skav212328  [mRNA]  locus=scaffold3374:201216:203163:- [translate_table: standard]
MARAVFLLVGLFGVARSNKADNCVFPNEPRVPYYWDDSCEVGELGCWADGLHKECRFCGDVPYVTECPEDAKIPEYKICYFPVPPVTDYYWEPKCNLPPGDPKREDEGHRECRFCGSGAYSDIKCPVKSCTFSAEPNVPHYWDSTCEIGKKGQMDIHDPLVNLEGCNADGIHVQCRFCDVKPFIDVPCPPEVRPPYPTDECYFPQGTSQTYFWDNSCQLGLDACYADGVHEQCRYCGSGSGGAYEHIPCPFESQPFFP